VSPTSTWQVDSVSALDHPSYAECPWGETLMVLILIVGIPLAALFIWGAVLTSSGVAQP
jgi:hypothetical protein